MPATPATGFAALLVDAWITGKPIASLPPALVPAHAEDAYAVQSAVLQRLVPRFGPVVGWKVGAPGPDSEPNAAPLLADLVQPSPARFGNAGLRVRGLEAELAFRFSQSLPPRRQPYDEAAVGSAIRSIHVAIELVESRLLDWKSALPLSRLADNQSNGRFCFGPALSTDWRSVDYMRQKAVLLIDGKTAAEAVGGNAAGHPLRLLVWLANHAAARGRGIAAGDIVTTGSHTGLTFANSTSRITARFPGLGESRLEIAED